MKLRLMHTIVESVLLYGCETWTLNFYSEPMLYFYLKTIYNHYLPISSRDYSLYIVYIMSIDYFSPISSLAETITSSNNRLILYFLYSFHNIL